MAQMVSVKSEKPATENLLSARKVSTAAEFQDLIHDFSDVLRQQLPVEFTPARAFKLEIRTDTSQPPSSRPLIRLSLEEQKELKKALGRIVPKRTHSFDITIWSSNTSIKKKDGALRMVWDYSGLKKMTIKDSNSLPLIEKTLDQLAEAKVYSKFDLVGVYHQLRIREEDIHKTAITTRFRKFEWVCFGLTNAPAAFSRLAADIFKEVNGQFLESYSDEVIIYRRSRVDKRG